MNAVHKKSFRLKTYKIIATEYVNGGWTIETHRHQATLLFTIDAGLVSADNTLSASVTERLFAAAVKATQDYNLQNKCWDLALVDYDICAATDSSERKGQLTVAYTNKASFQDVF